MSFAFSISNVQGFGKSISNLGQIDVTDSLSSLLICSLYIIIQKHMGSSYMHRNIIFCRRADNKIKKEYDFGVWIFSTWSEFINNRRGKNLRDLIKQL